MKERDSSVHWQILLLLGTCLRTGRSYYSGMLVCLLTEPGSPRGNGVTDDLGSCWSYSHVAVSLPTQSVLAGVCSD